MEILNHLWQIIVECLPWLLTRCFFSLIVFLMPAKMPKDTLRVKVTLTLTGRRAERLLELRDLLGFDGNSDTATYLINRGMETCAMQVIQRDQVRRLYADIAASLPDVQQMLEGLETPSTPPKKGKR